MTRVCNQTFHCSKCGAVQTAETAVSRWVRNNPRLKSEDGNSFTDQDIWDHKFKIDHDRSVQCLMLTEVKIHGAEPSESQNDTFSIINQLLRNRQDTPTKKSRRQLPGSGVTVFSPLNNRWVKIRSFGVHLLTFSGTGPLDSTQILWDKKSIDIPTLEDLLRFERDPDSLQPMDLRPHHVKVKQRTLFDGQILSMGEVA